MRQKLISFTPQFAMTAKKKKRREILKDSRQRLTTSTTSYRYSRFKYSMNSMVVMSKIIIESLMKVEHPYNNNTDTIFVR